MKNASIFIEINIEDDGRFTDVALLVDKDDFLNEVFNLRKKYANKYKIDLPTNDYSVVNEDLLNEVKHDAEHLRRKFYRPLHFLRAITKSILNGVVEDGDYSKAFLERKELFIHKDHEGTPDIKYSIVIFPGTRKKDVDQVFFQFSEEIKANMGLKTKTDKNILLHGYWYDPYFRKPFDTKTSIRKIREWYIKHKNGAQLIELSLEDKKSMLNKYREIKDKFDNHYGDLSDNEGIKYKRYLKKVENHQDVIKELLKRYRKLLMQS